MKLVSDDFRGDALALEDALLKDFRSYRAVTLDIIIDNVTLQPLNPPLARVNFHYNLTVVTEQGANAKFSGTTSYLLRREGPAFKLYQMQVPIIFGNSLPQSQNPVAQTQGASTTSSSDSTAPGNANTGGGGSGGSGAAATTTGGYGTTLYLFPPGAPLGFVFRTGNTTIGTKEGADMYVQAAGPGTAPCGVSPCLLMQYGGAIQDYGACGSVDNVASVPTNIAGSVVSPVVNECYSVKTGDSHYAIIKVTAVTNGDNGSMTFDYIYQSNGSNSFK